MGDIAGRSLARERGPSSDRQRGRSRSHFIRDRDTTAATPARVRRFGDFLFWYVAIQVLAASAFILTLGTVSFLGGSFHLLGQGWADTWAHAQGNIQAGATLLGLLACIKVAAAHNLGFWRGVGGWIAGNILGTIVMLPVLIVTSAGNFYALMALSLLYVVGSAVAIIWKRRRAARDLSERGVARVFD